MNLSITEQIANRLKESFEIFDYKKLANDIECSLDNLKQFLQFVNNNKKSDFVDHPIGTMHYTLTCFRFAGTNALLDLFNRVHRGHETEKSIIDFLEKRSQLISAKRDYKIANKINNLGATKLLESEVVESDDGFDGNFYVETDSGKMHININTIYAGGYNIQELHLRTLIKIKKVK